MPAIVIEKLLPALSWAFIHSLWQGLVLSVLAGLVVTLTRRSSASLRYTVLCMLFFLFLGGVVVSFILEWTAVGRPREAQRLTAFSNFQFGVSLLERWIENATAFLNANAQLIVLTWTAVVVFKSGGLLLDMLYLRRLRSHEIVVPEKFWSDRTQRLASELGIRKKVVLLESALVKVPVILGHFKPLILLPIGIVTHLPPGELEAVLLHELAHIRRHDYLINLIQRLSETIFFFNPGLLWVSSLLRVERENCCDDIAVSHTNNKLQFVEALIRCKEHSLKTPGYALGLFGKKNLLLQRIARIAGNNNCTLSPVETAFFVFNLVAMVLLFSGMRKADHGAGLPILAVQTVPDKLLLSSPAMALKPLVPLKKDAPKLTHNSIRLENRQIINRQSRQATAQKQKPLFKEEASGAEQSQTKIQPGLLSNESTKSKEEIGRQLTLENAEALRVQAEMDRQEAEKNRAQAQRDREQAERDREQAKIDRAEAEKDRQQAEKDREQAMHDRRKLISQG